MKGLKALATEWEGCQRCPLHETRNSIVFGTGPQNAKIVIVGEAPGAEEDKQGLPFVGKAGALLDTLLSNVGLDRKKVFLTNAVACRPPGNATPSVDIIHTCRPRLLETIYIIDPVLVVAMGKVAVKALTNKQVTITEKRGDIYTISVPGIVLPVTYPVLVTLHPAFLLRNPEPGETGWLKMVENDLAKARRIAALATAQ